jgi:multiple sugar transport system substrate-binding protein
MTAATGVTTLRALGWDHPRCMQPMRACAAAWHDRRPDVRIEWDARSLRAFGDEPLGQVAGRYDLLVIDHPFCGSAERDATLLPLDDLVPAGTMAALAAGAVGASHASYTFHDRQWGLATDAACQVAAIRPDLLAAPPPTWDDVAALAASMPGRVALPLAPPHAISSWLTLVAGQGGELFNDPAAGVWAATILAQLARLGPAEALEWEPPDALARMTATDTIAYIPLTYGYSGYSAGGGARACRFVDIPSAGRGPAGAVLGGAGLAVSAASPHPAEAAAFAAWASGAEAQRDIVGACGGQPAHRAAWDDPRLDARTGAFYSGTRATIEGAWVRPRDAWWPGLQLAAGELLTAGLRRGTPAAEISDGLHELFRRHSR